MVKIMKLKLVTLLALLPFSINAAQMYCNENITELRLHESGAIDFKSSKTCHGEEDGWCRISWAKQEWRDQAYSMLLAAMMSSREVTIYWRDVSSCNDKNKPYTQPASIGLAK